MRFWLGLVIILAIVSAGGYAAWKPISTYLAERNRPDIIEQEVTCGPISEMVNATGTVEPVLSIEIGAVVSGPIVELQAEFNQHVEKGQLLARIDPRIYAAALARDEATLSTAQAELQRVRAVLQRAINDEQRAMDLREQNPQFVSDQEMDQLKFNRISLEAQLAVAEAAIKQAQASLGNSRANLDFTEIRAPRTGMVIDRRIDEGQSLAAQFQTPVLFVVAPEMDKKMHIHALVDEADIGLIIQAEKSQQPVYFTVDAYPEEVFEGHIFQIRYSSAETQSVVTYPVIVEAPNTQLRLLPGMTANLSFQVQKYESSLRIPNAALRYYPDKKYVREEDQKLLENSDDLDNSQVDSALTGNSALDRAQANRDQYQRHVWIRDGDLLKAVEVEIGITESRFTQLVQGDLAAGDKVVIDIRKKSK